jgi:tRNA A58 N-methylase Trm61
MGLVVIALSQTGDVAALRAALATAGLPVGPVQVIAEDASTASLASGLAGADLLTSDSGTSVPGVSSRERSVRFFRNESVPDRLGDLEIPESELDNYADALHRGKSVVAYFAKAETIERVLEAFRSDPSLVNVRRY